MVEGFTTDELLDKLAEVGRPNLLRMESGMWHASIKFPAPDGVTASVCSEFDHNTHGDALLCVIERIGGLESMMVNSGKSIRGLSKGPTK